MKREGTIISFYSFKGGVGRTMSLVNIAVLLARKHKVLIVDFDLEAPGIDKFLSTFNTKPGKKKGGLLEILENANSQKSINANIYKSFTKSVIGSPIRELHYLGSGDFYTDYSQRVQNFNWQIFFEQNQGGVFLERLREEWKANYDFVFIDSRTGYSDTSGICTYYLPDILLLIFSANEQSVSGTLEVAEKANIARQKLAYDRMPLTIIPIPARIDKTVEYQEVKKWNRVFIQKFSPFYHNWLPKKLTTERLLEEISIPYIAYYSFGEKLPVLEDSLTSKESPAYFYAQIAKILESGFYELEKMLNDGITSEALVENVRLNNLINNFKEKLNDRQQAMIREVYLNKSITNKWCRETFNIVNDTVNRDLKLLLELGILSRSGKGRSTKYVAGKILREIL